MEAGTSNSFEAHFSALKEEIYSFLPAANPSGHRDVHVVANVVVVVGGSSLEE